MASKSPRRPRRSAVSARERAYRHIQEQISKGILMAGHPVSELLLAKELGSSRTPIREAIGQLAAEGLLEQTHHRGAVVRQLTRSDITDLYEVREALEVYAGAKVAGRGMQQRELQRLHEFNDGILALRDELKGTGAEALNEEQMLRFAQLDLSFHAQIVLLTLNSRMQKIINETRVLIQIFAIRRSGHDVDALGRIWQQHRDITEALAARNADAARKLLSEHILHSLKERLDEFEAWERTNAMGRALPQFVGGALLLQR